MPRLFRRRRDDSRALIQGLRKRKEPFRCHAWTAVQRKSGSTQGGQNV
ncbi:MAG: hypothetical protein JNJ46_06075 [Myxococcales bacterium]|nr:hypothetical protein [Myxococcales bacterium]